MNPSEYVNQLFNLTGKVAVAVVYAVATSGSIFGGWLPKKFINGGMNANRASKLYMFKIRIEQ